MGRTSPVSATRLSSGLATPDRTDSARDAKDSIRMTALLGCKPLSMGRTHGTDLTRGSRVDIGEGEHDLSRVGGVCSCPSETGERGLGSPLSFGCRLSSQTRRNSVK